MKAAQRGGCVLEVNAHPERLDLNDIHCKMAKDMGVKLVLSTDTHRLGDLDYMRFGVGQARRGWLEPDDVVNTKGVKELRKLLKKMMDFKKNPKTDFKEAGKLSKEQARQEIDALREGIEYHDYLYYVKDQPVISDETYDRLFRRLQELERAFPELASADSPTQRVGGRPAARLEKVRHTSPDAQPERGVQGERGGGFRSHGPARGGGRARRVYRRAEVRWTVRRGRL